MVVTRLSRLVSKISRVSRWLQFEASGKFVKLWLCQSYVIYVFNVNFEKMSHLIVDFAHKKNWFGLCSSKVTRLFTKQKKYFSHKREFPVLCITRDSRSVVQIGMSFTHHLIPLTRCLKLRDKKKTLSLRIGFKSIITTCMYTDRNNLTLMNELLLLA